MNNYYAVIDLEMCKVSKGLMTKEYHYKHEIIQIGAVLLDDKYNSIGRFSSYVCPQYGRIDSFIENLTGITQEDICDANSLEDTLKAFIMWLPKDAQVYGVSWSGTDAHQLMHELEGKGIDNPVIMDMIENRWIDAQKLFGEIIGKNQAMALEQALILSDIDIEGVAHDGLNDAINTAKLFAKMKNELEFKVNKVYEEARREETTHLSVNMGDLLKGLNLAV